MEIKIVEDAIIERLKAQIADIQVEGFPENVEQYVFNHPKAAILVQYRSSDFTRSQVLDRISQIMSLTFACILVSRGLRATETHSGAYTYLDQVREALTGFQPVPNTQGISKLQPTREAFIDENNGIWVYEIVFSTNGRNEEI